MTQPLALTHPLLGQGLDGNDITTVTLQPINAGHLRQTANIGNPELREFALLEKLTGLTPGQLDRLSVVDLEACQAVLRPLLPSSLVTGLSLSGFSLASLVGDPTLALASPPKTSTGGSAV